MPSSRARGASDIELMLLGQRYGGVGGGSCKQIHKTNAVLSAGKCGPLGHVTLGNPLLPSQTQFLGVSWLSKGQLGHLKVIRVLLGPIAPWGQGTRALRHCEG